MNWRDVPEPLRWLVVALAGAYAISTALLAIEGRTPDFPRTFVPYLLVLSLPCALVVVGITRWFDPRSVVWRALWLAIGVLMVSTSAPHILWPIGALIGVGLVPEIRSMRFVGRLAIVMALLVMGYAAVWNFNSLLAPLSKGRLGDPILIAFDLWLFGSPNYVGVFPVINSAWAFTLLERAYLFLFAEILTVALWLAAVRHQDTYSWIARLFVAYALGLVTFLVWPTVGPHIYAPESLGRDWYHTATYRTMQAMDIDYDRILAGGRGGINYFIAFPSLHVAAAVTCQLAVRSGGALFWLLLPVTTLVASSTFLLGYHYALDIPGGVLAALLAWWGVDRFSRRTERPTHL